MFKPISLLILFCSAWTLIPAFTLLSPPLDVVEMLAWGADPQWGYHKHPPLPAWLADLAYRMVGNHVWGVYALSQICIAVSFIYVYHLGKILLQDKSKALYATAFLTGVYYYSYPTPEFNHNVLQMPLWAGFSYYAAQIFVEDKNKWLLLGLAAGLAMLTKYSSALLILCFVFVYFSKGAFISKIKQPSLWLSVAVAFLIFLPHLIWLIKHDFQPITYAAGRVTQSVSFFQTHLVTPFQFSLAQAANIILPCLLALLSFARPWQFVRRQDERRYFLNIMCFGQFVLALFLGIVLGLKLLHMWGMPFWNLLGIWFFMYFQGRFRNRIFVSGLMVIVVATLTIFAVYHVNGHSSRRSFPADMLAAKIEQTWKANTNQPLSIIISDDWIGGNLALALPGRPKVFLYNDTTKAPWVSQDDVTKKGAVVLWWGYKPDHYPKDLASVEQLKIGKYDVTLGFSFPIVEKN